jgi:putative restriction endonuclease
MDRSEVLALFRGLTVWGSGDQRAPHKPLLVLYALGWWARDCTTIPFSSVNEDLPRLLQDFGPPRKTHHPEYPFWRLQNDGVWTVVASAPLTLGADGAPTKRELLRYDARGQFTDEVQAAFKADPPLVPNIAQQLLASHFPESMHQDILNSVGLEIADDRAAGGQRDPGFRRRVLTVYEHRCVICGLQLLLSGTPIALEAAHIKWHQASGPAIVPNGLCMCVLHHKLFDLGAFTISLDSELRVLVSDEASGLCRMSEFVLSFHGSTILRPIQPDALPSLEFIRWHQAEVFRGSPRPLR